MHAATGPFAPSLAEAFADQSADPVVALEQDGRIALWGEGARNGLGYSREDAVGVLIDELLVPPERRDEFWEHLATTFHRRTAPLHTLLRRKDGVAMEAEIVTRLVVDRARGARFFAITACDLDLGARRRAERALEATNRELEAFCYAVAHDLKAPLRGVNGFSHILLEDHGAALPADALQCVHQIQASAEQMSAHIDALLALARITRDDLTVQPVDLSGLVRRVLAELAGAHPERRVATLVEDGAVALLDFRLARTLVENVIGNAWKFTSKTPNARIEFGVSGVGREREFFVRDNGAGFDPRFAGNLFAPFQRMHPARDFAGSGIGLAIAQRIVHRHGGRIRAEGAVDRGTTVHFSVGTQPAKGDGS